ncbi:MAG: hypothetical protein M1835_005650 [Candelina submexicana]|nr:MAG: hypothetical protein M1835_005650 [Candelina submexicana]
MGFLSNPRLLLYIRYAQILISLIFFVLLCYSSTHRGYWDNISGAVGLGVFASIFTFTTAGYSIYTIHRALTLSTSTLITLIRLIQEAILVLAWAGTAALMIKPKGKNYKKLLDDPPWPTWTVDIVLAFVEL